MRKMDDPQINQFVRAGLGREWAPEQIAGRLKQLEAAGGVSSQTIYTWIKQDEHRAHWEAKRRRRGKRPFLRKNTATTGDAARIADRPEVVEQRLRLGDFEGDTVLGPAGTGGLATLVDRKSRFTIVATIQSKKADHVHEKLKQRLKELDGERRRSLAALIRRALRDEYVRNNKSSRDYPRKNAIIRARSKPTRPPGP